MLRSGDFGKVGVGHFTSDSATQVAMQAALLPWTQRNGPEKLACSSYVLSRESPPASRSLHRRQLLPVRGLSRRRRALSAASYCDVQRVSDVTTRVAFPFSESIATNLERTTTLFITWF